MEEVGIMTKYIERLKEFTNYDNFRPGQKDSLNFLEEGKNTLSILPTGGGKSLVYQLFQYQQSGHTVVISPLISLMQDQVEQLQHLGIKSVIALNSNLDRESQQIVKQQLDNYQFIFMSPEMVQRPDILQKLKQLDIHLLVIDEAHCISQWGFDFRPEYSELLFVREQLNYPLTLALTATATEQTIQDIKQFLFTPTETVEFVKTSIDRPNIFYAFQAVSTVDKLNHLMTLLMEMPKPGIVYVHQKQELEEIVDLLNEKMSLNIATYHADRSVDDRHIIQQQFLHGDLDVIFATSAFGMGINQANVRFIIHYHLPQSMEELSQEIGRAGRDVLPALSVVMYNQKELFRLKAVEKFYIEENKTLMMHIQRCFNLSPREQIKYVDNLNETQQAYIRFYSKHFNNMDAIQMHYDNLLRIKQEQIKAVINLVLQKTCYRQTLIETFNQQQQNENKFCCSNCQPDYLQQVGFTEFLALETHKQNKNKFVVNWQKKLENLFQK